MGVEKGSFGGIALIATFCVVGRVYWGLLVCMAFYMLARWLTKKDDQFIGILLRYLDEQHVYDATPRLHDYESRPKGWGKGLPL